MIRNQSWQGVYRPASAESKATETTSSPLMNRAIVIWLSGIVLFLPIKILNLPYNFELVDGWILMGLPIAILFFIVRPRQFISLSYLIPMWLVLVSSFLSSFAAPSVRNSLLVIFKEAYLFSWFLAVTLLLYRLKGKDLRMVFYVWSAMVVLHGFLMIAQFLSPEIWQLTNSLGGNSARVEGYRAAGLFICDKAGCANKAAYFQLLGFVPVLLSGLSRRNKILMGIILFVSVLTTGSMAATGAFITATLVSGMAIAIIKQKVMLVIKFFFRLLMALMLLAGLFLIVTSINQRYREHFEKIIVGRFERSSGGRLNLWSRGVDALLEHNAFFWGVGPENFRVVDTTGADNQLHNDTLAFLVERGLIGVLGLALFARIAIKRAIFILRIAGKTPSAAHLELVVFLAVIAATMVESITHQMFRTRELWLVLAIQEAVYMDMKKIESGEKQPEEGLFASASVEPSHARNDLVIHSEVPNKKVNGYVK